MGKSVNAVRFSRNGVVHHLRDQEYAQWDHAAAHATDINASQRQPAGITAQVENKPFYSLIL